MDPFKQRILEDSRLTPLLTSMNDAHGVYVDALAALEPARNPRSVEAALKLNLSRAKDIAEVQTIQAQLGQHNSEATELARVRAEQLASAEMATFREVFPPLLAAAAEVLSEISSEVISAEESFFAQFGMSRRQTAVSERVLAIHSDLERLTRSLVRDPAQPSPRASHSSFGPILSWFRE